MENVIKTLSEATNVRFLNTEQKKAFEKGLSLIESLPQAKAFIKETKRFKDYHRRVRNLLMYLKAVKETKEKTLPEKRRVGRPTKEEQAMYKEMERKKALEEAKHSLFPDMKPEEDLQPLTYGGIIANPNGESIAATMPHLMQIRMFLSPALQERVNTVRDLRNEMAAKAEQAKVMVEANEKAHKTLFTEDEISANATRAVEIESKILPAIYSDVDREMGEVYLRLSQRTGDPAFIAKIERECNIKPQDLRTMFKPFYEKALERDPTFANMVAEKIAADCPEVQAKRDAAAKHKAEADAIIKYITRKDKQSTETRVKGLEERIANLRENYSDIVSADELIGYTAILEKTREELEAKDGEKAETKAGDDSEGDSEKATEVAPENASEETTKEATEVSTENAYVETANEAIEVAPEEKAENTSDE